MDYKDYIEHYRRGASLDVIIFSEVLEHLGKPADAIAEAVRVPHRMAEIA